MSVAPHVEYLKLFQRHKGQSLALSCRSTKSVRDRSSKSENDGEFARSKQSIRNGASVNPQAELLQRRRQYLGIEPFLLPPPPSRSSPIVNYSPSNSVTPLLVSSASASFLRTSALNLRNAVSILSLLSVSRLIVFPADALPVKTPVSPPMKRPPNPKKVYAATSPSVEGRIKGVMSGIASVQEQKPIQ